MKYHPAKCDRRHKVALDFDFVHGSRRSLGPKTRRRRRRWVEGSFGATFVRAFAAARGPSGGSTASHGGGATTANHGGGTTTANRGSGTTTANRGSGATTANRGATTTANHGSGATTANGVRRLRIRAPPPPLIRVRQLPPRIRARRLPTRAPPLRRRTRVRRLPIRAPRRLPTKAARRVARARPQHPEGGATTAGGKGTTAGGKGGASKHGKGAGGERRLPPPRRSLPKAAILRAYPTGESPRSRPRMGRRSPAARTGRREWSQNAGAADVS